MDLGRFSRRLEGSETSSPDLRERERDASGPLGTMTEMSKGAQTLQRHDFWKG